MTEFDCSILTPEDRNLAIDIVGCCLPHPPVILAPDGEPYLYRWHVLYNNDAGNIFFHIQVKSDPERPLHDHPWDNTSVILSGGYDEMFERHPELVGPDYYERWKPAMQRRRKGDVLHRPATVAHRLILPPDIPYAMTLFMTGPKYRTWGFWYPDGFHDAKRHVNDRDPRGSVHVTEAAQ